MRNIMLIVLVVIIVSGCQAPQDGQLPTARVDQPGPTTSSPTDAPGASAPMRSMFSSWSMNDNAYAVDFSGRQVQPAADGSFDTSWRPIYKFSPTVWCGADTTITGVENAGTMSITRSLSTVGSAAANTRYCAPLEGTYLYTRTGSGNLELCRVDNGACSVWVAPS